MPDRFANVTESLSCSTPPADPLAHLSTRQLAVLLLRARGREMTTIARTLAVSRETAYEDLRQATESLRHYHVDDCPVTPACPIGGLLFVASHRRARDASPESAAAPGPYACDAHGNRCPPTCRRLGRWLRQFNRATPEEPRRG